MRVDELLLIRALNASRPLYFPTYAALRVLGQHSPKAGDGLLARATLRKLSSGDSWRYRTFQMYKGTHLSNGSDQHEYRSCLAPSPTTAIAEAVILAQLSADPLFATPPQVFSYRWPRHPRSGWSYEYFASGYKERNSAISSALRSDSGSVAVITDLKSFYPSVNPEALLVNFDGLLKKASERTRSVRDEILNFFQQLLKASPQGIPIGPSCGHLLGHIALRGVDRVLHEKFGGRYFRYVDDIILVVPRQSSLTALAVLKATVESEGLLLNEFKTATLDLHRWEGSVEAPDLQLDDSFTAFTSDLATYLAFHGDSAEELKKQFLAEGFSIPISRLLALSRYSRFRYFLRKNGRFHAASIFLSGVKSFIARAQRLRAAYEEKLRSLMDAGNGSEPELQRWRLQRARRVVNVLFYLWTPDAWRSKMAVFDAFPELVEQRSLATSLSKGEVGPILPFYGRGPAAFAEIWTESASAPASFQLPIAGFSGPEIESLVTLSLTGAIQDIPAEITRQQRDSRLLRLGGNDASPSRLSADLSYEDEIESLMLRTRREEIATLVKSRYAIQESSVLDALALLGSEYRS